MIVFFSLRISPTSQLLRFHRHHEKSWFMDWESDRNSLSVYNSYKFSKSSSKFYKRSTIEFVTARNVEILSTDYFNRCLINRFNTSAYSMLCDYQLDDFALWGQLWWLTRSMGDDEILRVIESEPVERCQYIFNSAKMKWDIYSLRRLSSFFNWSDAARKIVLFQSWISLNVCKIKYK